MNYYTKVPKSNLRRWTNSATECINNHCVCGRCQLLNIVYNCKMKRTVLELVREIGTPDNYIEPTIREDE